MSDSGPMRFATPDAIAGLLMAGASPRDLVLRLGGADADAVATDKDFYDGFRLFILEQYDYSKIFTEIVSDLEEFIEVCPALADTDVITNAALKIVESRNGPDVLMPAAFNGLVGLLKKAPASIQAFFIASATSTRGLTHEQEVDDVHNFEKPFSPQTRLGIALKAAITTGFSLDVSLIQERPSVMEPRGNKYVASYSAVEMSIAFKNAIPFRALPELLASKALKDYQSGQGIKTSDYEHIFDPSSEIFAGLNMERREKLARRFMRYFGTKLAREYGRDQAAPMLESLFGNLVDAHPDFNQEIRTSINTHLPSGRSAGR